MRKLGIVIAVCLLVVVLGLMLVSAGLLPNPIPGEQRVQSRVVLPKLSQQAQGETVERVEARPKLTAQTALGTIKVVGADVEVIEVRMNAEAKAQTAQRAQEILERITLDITVDHLESRLVVRFPKLALDETASADLILTVPRELELELITDLGDVEVTSVQGDLTARTALGTIRVREFQGNANLETSLGDIVISQASFTEKLTARSHLGDLNIRASLAQRNVLESDLGDIALHLSTDESYVLEGSLALGSINLSVPFQGQQTDTRIRGIVGAGEQRGSISASLSLGSLRLTN